PKLPNHATDLSCSGQTTVRGLRSVTIGGRVTYIEGVCRAAIIQIHTEQRSSGHVPPVIEAKDQSGPQLVLHAYIHLERARVLVIRREQTQSIHVRPRKRSRIPDVISTDSRGGHCRLVCLLQSNRLWTCESD